MAIITRPRFKISQDPNSNKVQGLRVGDLALRQYFDNTTQFYSLLLVDEIGGTQAAGNYFVGQLIDGDEPGATGVELLDFVRVTNIIDETRMGAVYISGSGSDAPRIDAMADGGKEASICYPTFLGAGGYEVINSNGTFGSGVILDEPQINSNRAFKVTRNATPAAESWFLKSSVSLSSNTAKMTVGKQYVISYRYRANKSVSISQAVSDSDGTKQSASWVDAATTSWKYRSIVFSCEYSTASTQWNANLASALSSGDWIEYADFTVIPVDSMKIIRSSVKSCVGNMNGITDPVFGQLRDYGGYFQRLYATKDVNIAGTLTAGDENGFGTTFYAGKIAKNLITNSDLRPENDNSAGVVRSIIQTSLPIGVVGSAVNLNTTGQDPLHSIFFGAIRPRSFVTFSVWAKSTTGSSVTLVASDQSTSAGNIIETHQLTSEWKRVFITFDTSRLTTGRILFRANPSPMTVGTSIQLWGYQVEYGKAPTPYQPTDGTLSSSTDYGMWANRGGFGGTIQNPILKLQPDGTIVGGNNKLILRPDGSAEFNGTVVISGSGGQPLDVEQAINQAKGEAISISNQFSTGSIEELKSNYLGELALLDTLDGHMITDETVSFAKLGSTIVSGGYVKTELLDADAIRTNIINVNYIEGLSLSFVRGNIGGWAISESALTSAGNKTTLSADGSGHLADGAISWSETGEVAFNASVKSNWESYTDSAKAEANAYTDASSSAMLTASNQYANSSIADLKTNYLGDLAILDTLNGGMITDSTISFAKLGSTIVSGGYIKTELLDANAIRSNIINVGYIEGLSLNFTKGFIGGWTISSAALSSIGNKSVLRSDGSGQLAAGNIEWDADGNVTFGENVQLNWKSATDRMEFEASNGYSLSVGEYTDITAYLYNGWDDITEKYTSFIWTRDSGVAQEDAAWNIAHKTSEKTLTLSFNDLNTRRVVFSCTATKPGAKAIVGNLII